jgi:hypothetical protein
MTIEPLWDVRFAHMDLKLMGYPENVISHVKKAFTLTPPHEACVRNVQWVNMRMKPELARAKFVHLTR